MKVKQEYISKTILKDKHSSANKMAEKPKIPDSVFTEETRIEKVNTHTHPNDNLIFKEMQSGTSNYSGQSFLGNISHLHNNLDNVLSNTATHIMIQARGTSVPNLSNFPTNTTSIQPLILGKDQQNLPVINLVQKSHDIGATVKPGDQLFLQDTGNSSQKRIIKVTKQIVPGFIMMNNTGETSIALQGQIPPGMLMDLSKLTTMVAFGSPNINNNNNNISTNILGKDIVVDLTEDDEVQNKSDKDTQLPDSECKVCDIDLENPSCSKTDSKDKSVGKKKPKQAKKWSRTYYSSCSSSSYCEWDLEDPDYVPESQTTRSRVARDVRPDNCDKKDGKITQENNSSKSDSSDTGSINTKQINVQTQSVKMSAEEKMDKVKTPRVRAPVLPEFPISDEEDCEKDFNLKKKMGTKLNKSNLVQSSEKQNASGEEEKEKRGNLKGLDQNHSVEATDDASSTSQLESEKRKGKSHKEADSDSTKASNKRSWEKKDFCKEQVQEQSNVEYSDESERRRQQKQKKKGKVQRTTHRSESEDSDGSYEYNK
ncbi:hypothetical protein KUTeg_012587 [Tegillarca granosa]|uniref:Uncharacterized protein n=1 Tax=Tegillarca granosa TaxID=220873 RepID=A0ABQ9F4A9_TEGGR|nr:hypothetical protein KUTeg_012587 [Tegillarca granosa]